MSKGIGRLVALGVTAVFIAFISVIADTAIRTEHASAGWCARSDADGNLFFTDVPSKIAFPKSGVKICEDDLDGAFLTNKQFERISNPPNKFSGLLPDTHPSSDFPAGWFESFGECNEVLASTGKKLPNTSGLDNRIEDVYLGKSTELAVQIAYDVGSNEVSGITGAIIGAILGVVKVPVFVTEWKYEVQDECQEIVERNTIQDINVDTEGIVSDVTTLLVDVATRSSQTSVDALSTDVDAVDAKVIQISTTLAALGASLTTETDEIDAALAALAASLTTETDEIDAALAALNLQLAAAQDQSVRLYIEDHLESCRQIASLLLADAEGLLPLVVMVVDDLATRAEAAGLNIGEARRHLALANDSILAGDARQGFQSLCNAYEQIVSVRGR